jgi:hypothetical protein
MAPRPRIFSRLCRHSPRHGRNRVGSVPLVVIGVILAGSCGAAQSKVATNASTPVALATSNVDLAGHRCVGATGGSFCRCRISGDELEMSPPPVGKKRFELRLSASGGNIAVTSDLLGRFDAQGAQTRCVYIDLISGSQAKMKVTATADDKSVGVLPQFSLSEYGPAGPFWYETLTVQCQGKYGQCDRDGADAWQASLAGRKRGRIDPCGSAVVKSLRWDVSGSESARDGEFFHDFTVSFDLDIKEFATQFSPGSTECVPK